MGEERFMDFVILYLVIFVLTIVLLVTPLNVVLRRFHDYLNSRNDENKEFMHIRSFADV